MKKELRQSILLNTDIAKAYWCVPDDSGTLSFKAAHIETVATKTASGTVCWLDHLLEGGVFLPELPDSQNRAVTILLTGSPGTGKSTLAMELCYRWTLNKQVAPEGLRSLYITTETNKEWIVQKARSFGWAGVEAAFASDFAARAEPPIEILSTEEVQACCKVSENLSPLSRAIAGTTGQLAESGSRTSPSRPAQLLDPDVLVMDSFNTTQPSERPEEFKRFIELSSSGPRILIVILDSGVPGGNSEFWEYASDIVIRMGKRSIPGYNYMIRTLEVVKARFQPHVWGEHQLKIYPRYQPPDTKDPEKLRVELRRAHPYRHEGGIFIFPSIHYYLSAYKRLSPIWVFDYVETPLKTLNTVLKGGLPKGRCTGIIGSRGGHKSHLGYVHLLGKLVESDDQKALVISLRDDEGTATKTMTGILQQQFRNKIGTRNLDHFLREDRLEVLYYPPGYITPDEFFHRMLLSIHRLKHGKGNNELSLLFNSLDQLSSRFPLCAQEEMFIPGIIAALSAEEITSIFVAVEEPGQPKEQYGLLSMAEAILSCNSQTFSRDDYLGHLDETLKFSTRSRVPHLGRLKSRLGDDRRTTVLRVERFAGGQAAGAGGILELIDKRTDTYALYKKEGLHFTPFSPRFSQYPDRATMTSDGKRFTKTSRNSEPEDATHLSGVKRA